MDTLGPLEKTIIKKTYSKISSSAKKVRRQKSNKNAFCLPTIFRTHRWAAPILAGRDHPKRTDRVRIEKTVRPHDRD